MLSTGYKMLSTIVDLSIEKNEYPVDTIFIWSCGVDPPEVPWTKHIPWIKSRGIHFVSSGHIPWSDYIHPGGDTRGEL